MRRHCLLFTVALAVLLVGCVKPVPVDRVSVLSPGRKMRLVFRSEMQMVGTSVEEESIEGLSEADNKSSSTVTKRKEIPYTWVMWIDMELPLSVITMPNSDSHRVTMTIHRGGSGISYTQEGRTEQEEHLNFEAGDQSEQASESDNFLRDTEYIAVVDQQGQLVSSDVTGEHWARRKRELAEAVKQGESQARADLALRWEPFGVFAAMEDAMAYLPPVGVQVGQSWTVRREFVLPYNAYGFYMLTNGCSYLKEKTTCTVQSLKPRGLHSIATIAIHGKRFPQDRESFMPRRVKHFELKGELKVNLNTGAIEKLRIESVPTLDHPKEVSIEVKLVEVVTLKPI